MKRDIFLIKLTLLSCFLLISGNAIDKIDSSDPPSPDNTPLMARYIVHNTDWASVATISTQNSILGYPFVSLKSFCDGPVDNSTGIPYFYMTGMDVSSKDLENNNSVTIMTSLAEGDFCSGNEYDPQDPRCPKVMITGKFVKLPESDSEFAFANQSLFERHPEMSSWPQDHNFYVAKIDMEQICVLASFGGIIYVSLSDYFNPNYTDAINYDSHLRRVSVEHISDDM
ncbi:protein CREG1-like [Sitophilus oryzae]|uniref:Protein CREG1-like n=1 Tax=Sitophilus oryzae TaxID=7048 RepID=A0A6J2Y280_SITOR|nr:protein CREG1-like [Sitophilus oryzae]